MLPEPSRYGDNAGQHQANTGTVLATYSMSTVIVREFSLYVTNSKCAISIVGQRQITFMDFKKNHSD